MEDLLAKLPSWIMDIPMYLGVLVVIATALVRIPGLSKYSDDVNKFVVVVQKILSWMPTLGKNPSTKALEEKAKK